MFLFLLSGTPSAPVHSLTSQKTACALPVFATPWRTFHIPGDSSTATFVLDRNPLGFLCPKQHPLGTLLPPQLPAWRSVLVCLPRPLATEPLGAQGRGGRRCGLRSSGISSRGHCSCSGSSSRSRPRNP